MATQAHCAYCFESLAASFERRQPLSLAQVEDLWEQYHASSEKSGEDGSDVEDEDEEMTDVETASAKPAAISRLLNREPAQSAASSSSSLPSSGSSNKSHTEPSSGTATPASSMSSRSSLFSSNRRRGDGEAEHPLFVTWNTLSRSGHKSLRGCIGTFEAQELDYGLRSYALTSAFEDVRFQPIPSSLLPSLSNHVTLLTNFSSPSKDPLDWELGKHGLRISFTHHGRRYGATYLPDVAKEQGWTKDETLISLMRKAGWSGSSSQWQKVWRDGRGELVTYEGKPAGMAYAEWKEWRDWVDKQEDIKGKGQK
ncbi:hypothetical protein AC578_8842 [Pseudocercospora eumusae]|uniref:AMMECR1 domain-containing protein n=1 Tax=Pseudocercospora eumusae TaxID=321146 RepID=A0A139H5G6_9PEZI|nr:hypothetical protein AC578_8842 [Pseudocercospora eumusae]